MSRSTRLLIWRGPDVSRFGFGEVCRLRLPDGCRLDVLDLDAEDRFAALRVTWPVDSITRVAVEASIEDWWRGMGRATTRPPLAACHPKPPTVATSERPSIRALLTQAFCELQGNFEAAVARKLERLIGPTPTAAPRSSASERQPAAPPRSSATVRRPTATTRRDARNAEIRARVVAALADGEPRSRGELLSAARLFEDQVPIVLQELRALRGLGVIETQGSRYAMKYALVKPTGPEVPPVVPRSPAGGTQHGESGH